MIGGWVVKYFATFVTGAGSAAAGDDYFAGFIQGQYQPIIWMFIFFIMTAFVVFNGVNKGIEKYSKILMPIFIIFDYRHWIVFADDQTYRCEWCYQNRSAGIESIFNS